jgi:catechol 2,3-dioxygenase-like lactoylglutathione lyase family enzyme
MSLSGKDAIVTLAVSDLDAARTFYGDTLGLQLTKDQEEGTLAYQSGGAKIFVYPSEYAGTNKATACTWIVGDVDGVVRDLKSKGVSFEHYDNLPDTKVEGDVHVSGDKRLAWFKDPSGNIHGIGGGK